MKLKNIKNSIYVLQYIYIYIYSKKFYNMKCAYISFLSLNYSLRNLYNIHI